MKKKIKLDIGEYYGETNEKGLADGRGIFTYFNTFGEFTKSPPVSNGF